MSEPVTLAMLGAVAPTQGIMFLYGQATELLKRRRERNDAGQQGASTAPISTIADAPILSGELEPVEVDEQVVQARSEELLELPERLSSYVSGTRKADPSNAALIARMEASRELLQSTCRQRITFAGVTREPPAAPSTSRSWQHEWTANSPWPGSDK